MSILDDLKATEDNLRGIKAPPSDNKGFSFGGAKAKRMADAARELLKEQGDDEDR